MERDHEKMQFLGLFGITKESYMIIHSWSKIFSLITLTLILPLSLIFLFHMEVSQLFFGYISYYPKPHFEPPQHQRPNETISSELPTFILFKLEYFALFALFSLHSTSAVVYTIASSYTGRDDLTFKKVMSVVPKVWKRLVITFVCTLLAFIVYDVVGGLVIYIWATTIREKSYGKATFVVIGIFDLLGLLYLDTVWQLANVVSVLEDSYGFKAMMKSNKLVKGKKNLSMIIHYMFTASFFWIQYLFSKVVVDSWKEVDVGFVWRIACGVWCVLVLSHLFLMMFVIQTVLYFVCKSYHHEIIDNSALSERLEVYQGGHQPLEGKHVQLDSHV